MTRVVAFFLGSQQFGAPIEQVKETIVLRPLTRVFQVPEWVAGIINLRGDVVAVLDLKAFFGLGRTALEPETRILIARSGGKTAGLLVDRLAEVKSVDLRGLQPATMMSPENAALAQGVVTLEGGTPMAILDVVKLFESERLRQFQRKTHA